MGGVLVTGWLLSIIIAAFVKVKYKINIFQNFLVIVFVCFWPFGLAILSVVFAITGFWDLLQFSFHKILKSKNPIESATKTLIELLIDFVKDDIY